jgi:hypothetical protein
VIYLFFSSVVLFLRGGLKSPKTKEAISKEAIPKEANSKEASPKEARICFFLG